MRIFLGSLWRGWITEISAGGWKIRRRLKGCPALLLLLPVLAAAQNGYVGSAACKTCHSDIWLNFYKNPHFQSVASGKEPPERTGCESCHGPGAAHVEARGGKTTIPHAFSTMSPTQVLDDCLQCHAKTISRANIRRSAHTEADVVCSTCHSIHKSQTPKFPARESAARALLSMPRFGARAVRYAGEASRERRRDRVLGLPQSAWNVRGHVAHGSSSTNGGSGIGRRRGLHQMPSG